MMHRAVFLGQEWEVMGGEGFEPVLKQETVRQMIRAGINKKKITVKFCQ